MEVDNHVMIDMETMGTESDGALMSFAAVVFDPGGQGHKGTFHKHIELQSCLESEESAHQALHDAQRQAEFVQNAYRILSRTNQSIGA